MAWKNVQFENGKYRTSSGGGGGGGTVTDVEVDGVSVVNEQGVAEIPSIPEDFDDLSNVQFSNLQDHQPLRYDATSQKWVNGADSYPPLIYSDTEREVGVWRDGKPLYQRTFNGTFASDRTELNINWGITGIQVLNIWGVLVPSDNPTNRVIIGSNYDASSLVIFKGVGGTGVTVARGNSAYFGSTPMVYVTIQYTKSGDTAGSGTWTTQGTYAHHYSTAEHVVGTWIDGKPLYEKTIIDTATRNTGSNTISTGISNLETLIELKGTVSYGSNVAWLPIPLSDDPGSSMSSSQIKFSGLNKNNGNITFYIGTDFTGINVVNKVIVTIQYTKSSN